MSQSPSLTTTLDLHGKVVADAISEVTLFLERIRRTRVNSSQGGSGGQHVFFVQIITGSGSVCLYYYLLFFFFLHLIIVNQCFRLPPLAAYFCE